MGRIRHWDLWVSFACLAAILVSTSTGAQAAQEGDRLDEAAAEARAVADATSALCDKRVALIGENGFHGDGRTSAFKARVVRALVERCGFTVVAFESGAYDFLAIERAARRGEAIPRDMVASAIGGLWNQNAEVQPLIDFLAGEAARRRVLLVGLDDQLGSRGSFYSLETMPMELGSYLPGDRGPACAAALRRRIWSDYSAEEPYTEDTRARLRECLDQIESRVMEGSPDDAAEMQLVIANFRHALDRDFDPPAARLPGRDASMFANLTAIGARSGAAPKIIVWAANGHVAKRPVPGSPFDGRWNLGSLVRQAFGEDAYALGFTAGGGSFRYTVRTPREIPPAIPGSLEHAALTGLFPEEDAVFQPGEWLSAQGLVPGAAFDDHQSSANDWSLYYDGVIVFRRERPPQRLDEN